MSTAADTWYLNFTVFSAFHELELLDLSWNSPSLISFEGSDALTKLRYLNLTGNGLGGSYLPFISKFTSLEVLVLNTLYNISGGLPPSGPIPINPSSNLSLSLKTLHFSRNNLSGGISGAFFNASSLIALDVRYNQFMGNLNWVQYLDNIRLLSLGTNMFEGQITTNLCKLQYLRIIDFSRNKLSGSLPACIGDIAFKGDTDGQIFHPLFETQSDSYNTMYDLRGFTFATKRNLYTYGHSFFMLMSGIDLSANMLGGEIPWELGNMSNIKSLNLSYNLFTGPIPATFAGMNEIESLDLSHNNLNGPIPWQLTQLSSLEVFSVAYNNLSGCIPNGGQFSSFGVESYLGNINLHKISEGSRCSPGLGPAEEKDVGDASDDSVLYTISAVSFVLAFWATVAFVIRYAGM
ncbi:hypothetical protein PR202_gb14148 [Eleusine coracana subsp. coracana]|uniref:Uncharacterized protein n=1 Tax=Eleusine coracana subsp. coracana TaxID=191504 RepID=A0AAV5EUN3_ELECO|nr:hypothetical protein PR202_gb14148 [Eleusine coracana subsp. coracana]